MLNVLQSEGLEQNPERVFPWGDLAIVALVTLSVGLLSVYFELGESTFAATRRWESLQLDELPAVLLGLSLTLTWFAWRRYGDARAELIRRRAAEARLASLLLDNRRLSQQYLQLQESERKLLARELHDELGQYLNAIKLDAVAIQQRADGAMPIASASSAIIRHTDHLYAIVRDLIRQLRPVGLDELGLKAALEQHVNDWRPRLPGVDFTVTLQGDLDTVGEPLALALYRLLQEGMTNLSRHARAEHVEIRVLRCHSSPHATDEVVVSMVDDGCGADLSERKFGLGLIGMRERVEMLGGQFHVTTEPARGFGVLARIPANPPLSGAMS